MILVFLILFGVFLVISSLLRYSAVADFCERDINNKKKEIVSVVFLIIGVIFVFLSFVTWAVFSIGVNNESWPIANEEKIDIEILDLDGKDVSYITKDDNEILVDTVDKIYADDDDTYIVKATYTDGFFDETIVKLYAPVNAISCRVND